VVTRERLEEEVATYALARARNRPDAGDFVLGDALKTGLADAVNDDDDRFPPEFRFAQSKRKQRE
jgi:hypothetical protein